MAVDFSDPGFHALLVIVPALVAVITTNFMIKRHLAQSADNESRRIADIAFKSIVQSIVITDIDHKIISVNDSFTKLTGWTKEEVVGRRPIDFFNGPLTCVKTRDELNQCIDFGSSWSGRIINYKKNGDWYWNELTISVVRNEDGDITHFVEAGRDITTEVEKREMEVIAATAFRTITQGLVVVTPDFKIVSANKQFCKENQYDEEEIIGNEIGIVYGPMTSQKVIDSLNSSIEKGESWHGEVVNYRRDGSNYWIELDVTPIFNDNGEITHYIGVSKNIDQRKIDEAEIRNLAYYDHLTKLPNRRMLLDRLNQLMKISRRSNIHSALMFIDLDNFKTLNDTKGHQSGDLLLQQVADRLTACVRSGDTVARIGGDEFVVMLANLSKEHDQAVLQAEIISEKILLTLDAPYVIDGYQHISTASIGITLFGDKDEDTAEPMQRADIAMYQAKTAGRNNVQFFDPQEQIIANNRITIESKLRNAIIKQHFALYYQAQVNAYDKVIGAEALLRWFDPESGRISPIDFISIAEKSGLIIPIGKWVLETACAQLRIWNESNDERLNSLRLAVNVSSSQFNQEKFVDEVKEIIAITKINPRMLKLELTESVVLNNIEKVIEKMRHLKSMGLSISLDDFGTGYSSLSYLRRLPLDQLKIDQSFVQDILRDEHGSSIVAAVIKLADNLGLEVVAEGVETDSQRDFLLQNGCSMYQGYLFSKALEVSEFEQFVNQSA